MLYTRVFYHLEILSYFTLGPVYCRFLIEDVSVYITFVADSYNMISFLLLLRVLCIISPQYSCSCSLLLGFGRWHLLLFLRFESLKDWDQFLLFVFFLGWPVFCRFFKLGLILHFQTNGWTVWNLWNTILILFHLHAILLLLFWTFEPWLTLLNHHRQTWFQ